MTKIILVCNSVTHAQRIMSILTKHGYWAGIDRTPSQIRLKTCSYSVTIHQKDFTYIQSILNSNNIKSFTAYVYENKTYQRINGDLS